jgi:hypothetical protein
LSNLVKTPGKNTHPLAKENARPKIFYKNPEESCQEFDRRRWGLDLAVKARWVESHKNPNLLHPLTVA